MNNEERLENAVIMRTPEGVASVCRQTSKKTNAGWALAFACRFRGLEYVKALVENGATLHFEYGNECKSFYWLALLDVSTPVCIAVDYSTMASDIMRIFRKTYKDTDTKTVAPRNFRMLSAKRRAEIVSYLWQNCDPSFFDAGELLFYSIMGGDKQMTEAMKKMGIVLSEKRVDALIHGGQRLKYREFCNILKFTEAKVLCDILRNVANEMGDNKLYYPKFFDEIYAFKRMKENKFFEPEVFKTVLEVFDQRKMPKLWILDSAIRFNRPANLEECVKYGWLTKPRDRDEMIEFATKLEKTECLAFLLDYKNRNFDLEAEREKAEKKEQRLLNASPDSIIALRELFRWKKQEDGTVIITGYKGTGTLVKVPSKIGRSAVTAIGEQAFSPLALSDDFAENLCSPRANITEIILPDSIRSIGKEAFAECLELQRINIPDKVRSIGERAFKGAKFKEIALPDSYKGQGKRFFSSCWVLKSVRLSPNMTAIGTGMFLGCKALRSIELPPNIKRIGKHAFEKCESLEELLIPEGTEKLGDMAIACCSALKTVVIPATVKEIAEHCFLGSADFTAVVELGSYAEEFCKKHGIAFVYKKPEGGS